MNRIAVAHELVKVAKALASPKLASLPGPAIRSTLLPLDVLAGTKLFLVEEQWRGAPLFTLMTRWEVFGHSRDINKATDAFEAVALVENDSDIARVVKQKGLKLRKPSK